MFHFNASWNSSKNGQQFALGYKNIIALLKELLVQL